MGHTAWEYLQDTVYSRYWSKLLAAYTIQNITAILSAILCGCNAVVNISILKHGLFGYSKPTQFFVDKYYNMAFADHLKMVAGHAVSGLHFTALTT